ncbi:MORN repeat-containing protein [Faustovirus]|nr:MORN repeat-containing protein [Faustovirus]QBR99361.1 toxin-antitoxin system YwqK family protein [Faustovirus mariensis]
MCIINPCDMELVSETTTNTAIVYQVNADGKKHGYYRESIWNASDKFLTIYNPREGTQQILRPPDVVAEYTYSNDTLHGSWYIKRQHVGREDVFKWICNGYKVTDIPLPERMSIVGNYKYGKKQGIESEYTYGRLIRESRYHEGKLNGVVRKYYPDGKLLSTVGYTEGVKHGTETHFTQDGAITKSALWSHNRAVVV